MYMLSLTRVISLYHKSCVNAENTCGITCMLKNCKQKNESETYASEVRMADVNENSTPQLPRLCSQSKCKKTLDAGYQFRSCEWYREHDKVEKQWKWQHEKEDKEAWNWPRVTASGNCPEVIVIDAESSDDKSDREVSINNLVIITLSTHCN